MSIRAKSLSSFPFCARYCFAAELGTYSEMHLYNNERDKLSRESFSLYVHVCLQNFNPELKFKFFMFYITRNKYLQADIIREIRANCFIFLKDEMDDNDLFINLFI